MHEKSPCNLLLVLCYFELVRYHATSEVNCNLICSAFSEVAYFPSRRQHQVIRHWNRLLLFNGKGKLLLQITVRVTVGVVVVALFLSLSGFPCMWQLGGATSTQ